MNVILVTLGTDGDVFPYAALGAKLRERGHRVQFVATAIYQSLAESQGFDFHVLISKAENDELFDNPDFWNPRKCGPVAAKWGVKFIRRQYELLATLITRDAVLVVNPSVFAAAMVHEKFGTPMASVLLQPGLIPSSIAPPIMPGFMFMRRAPRPLWDVFWRGLDACAYLLVGRTLNPIRKSLGLKPLRRIFRNWHSPQLAIGLFPAWYGPPQADWPPQMRLFDFPTFDGKSNPELPPPVMEFCRAGTPPVVFTFGTGMAHSARLFKAALDACQLLGTRALFLTKFPSQLPRPLPPNIMACEFAPFQKLFPECAAVVHHGGVGTAAKAMAAGLPQLVCPICFDQLDNSVRLKELGVGEWLKASQVDGKHIAAALTRLRTPERRARCREIATRFGKGDGLDSAAEAVESLGDK